MNHWAKMLYALPAEHQKLIARTQRISLPRGADHALRSERLRRSLCRARTVRAIYANLEAPIQDALQELRQLRGGIAPKALAHRFGPVRSLRALRADPIPRSISERLFLLGWLIPRAATPRHPARYILPPEVRNLLPQPLAILTYGCAPMPPIPAALQSARILLRAAYQHPLSADRQARLTIAGRKRVINQIILQPADDIPALLAWLAPLLVRSGLLLTRNQMLTPTAAADRFLRKTPHEQLEILRAMWETSPLPDTMLKTKILNKDGIDWPVLRRRLCAWVQALPSDQCISPDGLYELLAATHGPLADAHTHGFRHVDRTPWQLRRAAAVFSAAIHGPLAWLGFVAWHRFSNGFLFRPSVLPDLHEPVIPTPEYRQQPTISLRSAYVLEASPAVLQQLAGNRRMRLSLGSRIAPGLACVDPKHIDTLVAALEHAGITVHDQLSYTSDEADGNPWADDPLTLVEQALTQGLPIEIEYHQPDLSDENGTWSRRIIRPLLLERRAGSAYLHAYCTLRHAERMFRVDRIGAARMVYSSGSPPTR